MRASELDRTSVVAIGGAPHTVENISVQSPSARGGATLYKVRFRNVVTKQKVDQTLKGEDRLDEASFDTREVQFLFKNGDRYTFMDLTDYTQFEMVAGDIEESIPYLVDDMEGITALISDDRVIGIRMPDVVVLKITECDPSIKGASATSRSKPATLQTGLIVQVPEYIAPEDVIRVDTRTNVFLGRA